MYNEEQKKRFIQGYTTSISTASHLATLFSRSEKFETDLGKDICEFSLDELEKCSGYLFGVTTVSKRATISMLRQYCRWCISSNISGATDAVDQLKDFGTEQINEYMFSSPLHLQRVLDQVFSQESELGVDNTYRLYCWFAYSGIRKEDALFVRNCDVDTRSMEFTVKGVKYDIYKECLPALNNCLDLESFVYKHPLYSKEVVRNRTSGDYILRGLRDFEDGTSVINGIAMNIKRLKKEGVDISLRYNTIRKSGIFYRAFNLERAGFDVDFRDIIISDRSARGDKEYTKAKVTEIQKMYQYDYERWKNAFGV